LKTIRGVVASMAVTPFIGLLLDFDFSLAASLAGLSMLADLGSSFVKRRLGLDVHARAFGLDQVPEALLPLLLFHSTLGLNWSDIVVVVLAFVLFEMVLSRVLYKIGIRAQPY
jgi:CDP-archaeol synthase